MKAMLGLVALMISTNAMAGPTLWNGVGAGMTKAEVRSMFPVGKGSNNTSMGFGGSTTIPFDLSSGCAANAWVYHPDNQVSVVEVMVPRTVPVAVL
jgi:hypothetical protein